MLDVGLRLAIPTVRTVCYVEIEAFPCEVLVSRMEDKILDEAPIWTDLRTFNGRPWRGIVDCIVGGYPCQPFSNAGRRKGTDDPRHLWPHIRNLVEVIQPSICFFENVEGHLTLGFSEVRESLLALGYEVEAGIFSATEVGAPHGRRRLYILAHSKDKFCQRSIRKGDNKWESKIKTRNTNGNNESKMENSLLLRWGGRDQGSERSEIRGSRLPKNKTERSIEPVGYYYYPRLERWNLSNCGRGNKLASWPPGPTDFSGWKTVLQREKTVEPAICRVVDGVDTRLDSSVFAYRIDRLRAVGNGVVPLTAATAFCVLWNKLQGIDIK